jgi:hypothetical protein
MLHVAPRLAAVALAAFALGTPLRPLPRVAEAGPAPRAAVTDTVVRFRLEDQFGRVHTPATYAGAPMFIVGADQGGRATARAWALALTAELEASGGAPGITVLPVADLRRVPRLLRRLVRGRFPKEKGEQVLLDWEGTLARAYAFTPDECTVLLVGPTGQVVRRASTAVMDSAMVREFARLAVSSSAPAR